MFLVKSFISIIFLLSAILALFTMFEVLGRKNSEPIIIKLKKIHKINGICFFILYVLLSYLCIDFIVSTKAELLPRGAFHSILALSIIILLFIKMAFIKRYTEFYRYVKGFGIALSVIAILSFGTSAGYYLLISELGSFKISQNKSNSLLASDKNTILTDEKSINSGRELFENKCSFCHDDKSKNKTVGPGLQSILKEKHLPFSKKPATAENIIAQIKNPIKDMPAFAYLSEEELRNLIAYLNTL